MCCPALWGGINVSGWYRMCGPTANVTWPHLAIDATDPDQTLKGSYQLLRRLREAGIRAHSWV